MLFRRSIGNLLHACMRWSLKGEDKIESHVGRKEARVGWKYNNSGSRVNVGDGDKAVLTDSLVFLSLTRSDSDGSHTLPRLPAPGAPYFVDHHDRVLRGRRDPRSTADAVASR